LDYRTRQADDNANAANTLTASIMKNERSKSGSGVR
jgi:hypothetical protein